MIDDAPITETQTPETEDTPTITCVHCHEEIEDGEQTTGPDDAVYCESCYIEHFFCCDRCSDSCPTEDLHSVGDDSWCESCYSDHAFCCCDCGENYRLSNAIGYGDDSLCRGCYEDSYFTCEDCREVSHVENSHCSASGHDGMYCDSCFEEQSSDDCEGVLDYSANVVRLLHPHIDPSAHLLGVELECESSDSSMTGENAADCVSSLGTSFAIAKCDGSLRSGHGFELVTIPANLDEQREHWKAFFRHVPRGLKSWDTSGRCGMHVHASRAPLSGLTIGKILVFINSSDNQTFVEAIAGRRSQSWAAFSDKKISDGKRCNPNRYEAVNLQNSATIEFRIFRGSLKPERFLKNLDFIASTIAFCVRSGIRELTIPAYLKWFKEHRKDYEYLDSWLVQNRHISPRSTIKNPSAKKVGA